MLIGCVDIIEDDSNNFEESDFNSDVLKYCSTAIVLCGIITTSENLEIRLLGNVAAYFTYFN